MESRVKNLASSATLVLLEPSWPGHLGFRQKPYAHLLMCMQNDFWCAWAHILAKLGQIREIRVSIESGGMPVKTMISLHIKHACMLMFMHTIFWHEQAPYIGLIGSDQRYEGIYGIRGTCHQYYDVSAHACRH